MIMCLYPMLIKNKKYIVNKKNKGLVPTVKDKRVLWTTAACGKCYECRKQKAQGWRVRMMEELKECSHATFLTLTLSDESIFELTELACKKGKNPEDDNVIAGIAIRKFLENHRKHNKKQLKHWFITEKGGESTKRLHIHGIVFGRIIGKNECEYYWKKGQVFVGQWVNNQTINYIIKYCLKNDENNPDFEQKIFCSPGIGSKYIRNGKEYNKFKGEATREYYRTSSGHKVNLPTYYRNKLWNDNEREELWINRLNKGTIWIMGEEVKLKNDGVEKEYNQLLDYYRKKFISCKIDKSQTDYDKIKEFKKFCKLQEESPGSVKDRKNRQKWKKEILTYFKE